MRPVGRAREMTAQSAAKTFALAFAPAKHGESAPASRVPAAATAVPLRSAACWRRSDNSHRSMRDDGPNWRDDPPASLQMRFACCPRSTAAAGRDHRDACGRMTRPSEWPAQIAPTAHPIGSSTETNSSVGQPCTLSHLTRLDQPCLGSTEARKDIIRLKLRRFLDCLIRLVAITSRSMALVIDPLHWKGS